MANNAVSINNNGCWPIGVSTVFIAVVGWHTVRQDEPELSGNGEALIQPELEFHGKKLRYSSSRLQRFGCNENQSGTKLIDVLVMLGQVGYLFAAKWASAATDKENDRRPSAKITGL